VLEEDDGLRVGVCEVDGSGSKPVPSVKGDGAYLVVLRGTMSIRNVSLSAGSVVFLAPLEAELNFHAEQSIGYAKLGLLQFPSVLRN
jgi:hypothetical protein